MITDEQARSECRRLIDSGASDWLIRKARAQAFSLFESAETPEQAWNALLMHRITGNLEQIILGEAHK